MKHRYLASIMAAACLAAVGCAQPTPPAAPPLAFTTPEQGTVTATAKLSVVDATGRQLLAAIEPWKFADIDHVQVALFKGADATPLVALAIGKGELARPITFSNLRQGTAYRVEIKAWSDAAEATQIDNLAADAASCTTAFTTSNVDSIDIGALKLRLKNKVFEGKTTGSAIAVTDGTLVPGAATEAIAVVPLTVTTAAGSTYGFADGPAATAQFSQLVGLDVGPDGSIFVSDYGGSKGIRKFNPTTNEVTTLASGLESYNLVVAPDGTMYVASIYSGFHGIKKVTAGGTVSDLAGGSMGFADGPGAAAQFSNPSGLALDADGNLYVADGGNGRIRKIDPSGVVTTFATVPGYPSGLARDASGNFFVTGYNSNSVMKVAPDGTVTTLAGGSSGYADGMGSAAKFERPRDIVLGAGGVLFVGDTDNMCIRKVTQDGSVTTYAGLWVADPYIPSIAMPGYADGAAATARFGNIYGLGLAPDGALYVSDYSNSKIRKVY